MKIVLAAHGTGGHFYPLIAVAESLRKLVPENLELFYLAPDPYNKEELDRLNIHFKSVAAGKLRHYFSIKNFTDVFKTFFGILQAIGKLLVIYPDAIFAKGGYASFPILFAARLLRIPVVIHESDAVPGRTNKWAGKFARRIALSYASAAEYFENKHVAVTGNPIRDEIKQGPTSGGRELLGIPDDIPIILILGGSQGAAIINDLIIKSLARLVEDFYVIHQAGPNNFNLVKAETEIILDKNPNKNRYILYPTLNSEALSMAGHASDIVITRAGSSLFEVASWGIPAIVIPITSSVHDHQRKNAYAYAHAGAGIVMEEANLSDDLLLSELTRILQNRDIYQTMSEAARKFATLDAADTIARELIEISADHKYE